MTATYTRTASHDLLQGLVVLRQASVVNTYVNF